MLSTVKTIIGTTGLIFKEVFQEITTKIVHYTEYDDIPELMEHDAISISKPTVDPLKRVARPSVSDDYLINQIYWLAKDKKWSTLVKKIQDSLKKRSVNTVKRADEMLQAIDTAKEAHKNASTLLFGKDSLNTMDDLHCQISAERTRLTSGLSSAIFRKQGKYDNPTKQNNRP